MSKGQGVCIFCNGKGVTKQHVFPNWLRKVIPREGDSHTQVLTRVQQIGDLTMIAPNFIERQGHIGVRKIRNVCGKCNNEWMSRLETKAKPALTSMMKGEDIELNAEVQSIIASWIVMTTIMYEYTDIEYLAITAQQRAYFMEYGKAPEQWQIWIGKYKGNDWNNLRPRHHGVCFQEREQGFINMISGIKLPYNAQSTTIVLGELLIHAVSIAENVPVNYSIESELNPYLLKIFPLADDTIHWPPSKIVTDEIALSLSNQILKK